MSEPVAETVLLPPAAPSPPRCCATCAFWQVDDHKGSLALSPWGFCWVGFDPALRLPNRTSTDISLCSRHEFKVVTP